MRIVPLPVIRFQRTGRNIEQLRRKACLTVRQLPDYSGFEYPQAICKWRHGECLRLVDFLAGRFLTTSDTPPGKPEFFP